MSTPSPRTVIQGADVSGLDIRPQGSRAGHADRERYGQHLRNMEKQGYLTREERDRRLDFAGDAEQHNQLQAAVSDLPAFPLSRRTPRDWIARFSWEKPASYAPALLASIALSAVIMITPAVIIGFRHPAATAVSLSCVIIGAVVLIASVITLAVKLSE